MSDTESMRKSRISWDSLSHSSSVSFLTSLGAEIFDNNMAV
ncbi:unannotated protein [freshwater metagenome]|uniref:Unannotated protein n=1 Tax=freshwater metagenome TaxID=449393 RepID=A0A6J6J7W5_9ZZZZ